MINEVTQDVEEQATAATSTVEQSESTNAAVSAAPTEAVSEESSSTGNTSQGTAESQAEETPEPVQASNAESLAATAQEPNTESVSGAAQEPNTEPLTAPTEEPNTAAPDAGGASVQEPNTDAVTATAQEPNALPAAAPTAESAPAKEPNTESIAVAVQESVPAEEPQTPSEVDFGAILEQFEQEQTIYHAGELVEGQVVGITDRGVLVDFGYKSEGFVPVEEFTGPDGEMTVNVGETVEVVIRTIHTGDSAPQLSRTDALARKVWDVVETAFQNETAVTGRVVDKTKGGLRVDLNGIEAFLPGSQIDSRPIRGLDSYIGHDIEAKIIKFSRRRNNIVLSRKVLTDELVNAQKAETLAKIDLGYVVEGTIKNLTEYGAFVDIGGIDGLLHVTDMSWGRIHHPADQFKVGEHLQVKVLKLDREKEKVSLGYKQLLPDPWSTVVEVYPVDSKVKGIVSSVTEYGVFVELEPGVEGLVHVSEISWSRRSQSPKRMFHRGQEVDVQILGVDTVEKRISLGMKQFQENPWDTIDMRYPVGSKIHGRVRNLTEFGAFVELEEGIDGLVHVSDISWAKKIKHPKDVLKKDQEVDAIVTSIDKRNQRLSLSMKDLTPSAWEGFVATHRPGDVVRGKVSRFTNFGVFVELGEGLEGLCHISELSDTRVDRAESVAQLGQEMDFKILRIEQAEQKIGLSHRAVGKEDEPVADAKMYSSEAKGGMASLRELANLKFGGPAEEAPKQEDTEEKRKVKQAAKKVKAEEFAAKEAAAEIEAASAEAAAESASETETPVPAESQSEEAVAEEKVPESAPDDKSLTKESAGETPEEIVPAKETVTDTPAQEAATNESAIESEKASTVAETPDSGEKKAAAATKESAKSDSAVADEASQTKPAAEVTTVEETAPVAEEKTIEKPAAREEKETPEQAAPAEEKSTEKKPSSAEDKTVEKTTSAVEVEAEQKASVKEDRSADEKVPVAEEKATEEKVPVVEEKTAAQAVPAAEEKKAEEKAQVEEKTVEDAEKKTA